MPDAVIIRPATKADLPAILEIYNHAILHTTAIWQTDTADLDNRAAWLAERQDAGYPVLAATISTPDGVQVVGYGTFGPFRPHHGYQNSVELSIYVAERARRQGIAHALLDNLESIAREQKRHVMIGGLDADNEASMHLHARHGFEEVARIPEVGRKFDRWLTLVLTQKILD